MAALRRIIASKQHPSADPPSPLPHTQPLANESNVSLNKQCPAWSDAQVAGKDQQVSSSQCGLTPTKCVQQAEGTPLSDSQTGHPADGGVAAGDTLLRLQLSGSTSAHAEPSDEATGSASHSHHWQVRVSLC